MDKKSIVIHDRSKVIFQDSIDGIKTASMGKRKKLYLNHIQFSSIEDGKKYNKEMKNHGVEWVVETLKKKNCTHYCNNIKAKKENICYCGRAKSDHLHDSVKFEHPENFLWKSHLHTCESKTNAYGEVIFQGTGKKTRAKYVRVSDNTCPTNIVKLLRKVWMMEYPQLLISVTGGAKSFKLNPKIKSHFTEGLLKVVQTTCTWVVTGGTNTGVMKHVGEALQGATTPTYCLGIATWGIINDRKRLKNLDSGCSASVDYHISNSMVTRGACLDNNHSHFVLVDKGQVGKYGHEILLRGSIEQAICNMKIEKNRHKVPGVQLVLEGGPNTIETVLTAINNDPPMPVVVIKGSGRAADLIAMAHQLTRGEGPIFEMHEVVEHNHLIQMIEKVFPDMNAAMYQKIYQNLLKCVEKRDYITVFKMEEGANIDEAILTAFMKGNNVTPFEQLDLAMLWNRVDIARNNIFCDKGNWTIEELHLSMYNALRRNKPEFVQLLLENGVVMTYFLTTVKLEDLYESCLLKEEDGIGRRLFDSVMSKFSGSVKMEHVDLVLKKLCRGLHIRTDEYRHHTIANELVMVQQRPDIRDPLNELFVWAVLCNFNSMAMMLWKHGDEPMAKALVGRRLYMAMAKHARKYHLQDDVIQDLECQAEVFGQLAIILLNEAFQLNERTAGDLVTCNLTNWGNQTCLSLAVLSRLLGFVAHPCIQGLLNEKWTDALQFTGSQIQQVLLGLVFPLFVMRLKFKSLKEYKLILLTETEYKDVEDKEKTIKQEIELSRTIEKKNAEHGKTSIHEDSLELVSNDTSPSRSVDVGSSGRVIEETFEMPWYMKYLKFYTAPVTKFVANIIAYLCFLSLFIFVITTELPKDPFPTEWFLVVMVISYTIEEIRQVMDSDANSFFQKFKIWSSSYWNVCDATAILLFFVAFALRLAGSDNALIAGHVCYAVDVIFWILRILEMFRVNKHLGPYVVMIGKMTIDMGNFLLVLVIFTVAYGVSRYAILHPYTKRSWKTLGELVMVPYFQLYGELFLEYPQESPGETIFKTESHGFKHIQVVVSVIMAGYLLVANILLINLLIAIFNNTYTKVQANSNEIWKFQRYNLIQEYSTRSAFFPPLSIVVHVAQLVRWLFVKGNESHVDKKLKKFLKKDDLHDVILFEEKCLASYLRRQNSLHSATQEEKLRIMSDRLDGVSKVAERYIVDATTTSKGNATNLNTLKDRMNNLENLMCSMASKITELHATTIIQQHHQGGGTFPQQPNYHRSVSEYPGRPSMAVGGGWVFPSGPSKIPGTPSSLPVNIIWGEDDRRRASATSLNLPPNIAVQQPYPNRRAERSSFVRRAAHNFRKGSLVNQHLVEGLEESDISGSGSGDSSKGNSLTRSVSLDVNTKPYPSNRRRTLSDVNRPEEDRANEKVRFLSPVHSEFSSHCSSSGSGENPRLSRSSSKSLGGSHPTLRRTSEVEEYDFPPSPSPSRHSQQRQQQQQYEHQQNDEDLFIEHDYEFIDDNVLAGFQLEERINVLSRFPDYPFSNAKRDYVPDSKVPWNIPYESYDPPTYTSPTVSCYLPWTDPDTQTDKFKEISFNQNERVSFHGDYQVIDGIPRNPNGRTGLEGRGLLCKYGPNHMQFALITKFKKNCNDLAKSKYNHLELLVMVQKNGKISLPNSPESNKAKDTLPADLHRTFSQGALLVNKVQIDRCDGIWDNMQNIIKNREKIFEGYVDDKRNTDNSWIEATVYNYHDGSGDVIQKFIHEKSSAIDGEEIPITPARKSYQWRDLNTDLPYLLSECYECIETPVSSWLGRLAEMHSPIAQSK